MSCILVNILFMMFTTYQFGIQISIYWKFHCIVEVVSLIGFVPFVKGPMTGTVHDKDHIFSCFVTSHIFILYFQWIDYIFRVPWVFCAIIFSLACQAGSAKMWNYHVQS